MKGENGRDWIMVDMTGFWILVCGYGAFSILALLRVIGFGKRAHYRV